ncbi:hypothetical protein QJ856_gp0571 [Tupanvirus deep ocean]|uniref:Uncharacterized protein n=2 Tax=Tupanvirus TaxID=2094720 RepID=A0AC62A8T5_9VIRU|nr:hypothetical protein QJ856_gp0571 [Tupanvirus deep ocean]QKU34175.1 hypothetical protein [Tupanvirus deep ocean]
MYVNQIDNIIDQILDQLYLEGLAKDDAFNSIVQGKKINYVEYRDKINNFIQNFMQTIDISAIQKLINNKENLIRILDIIKRYVAYYYFLSIAYHYTGTIKDFRNNLIQYSKLQENSTFTIKNFFDTENNYQIITFFKIIKDVSNIITMTELQKKTLNPLDVKDAVNFLNGLGKDYIDNYLLMIVRKGEEEVVEINVHNLIKTIVFGEIYRNQEQNMVFEILNDIEEDKHEYTFIDIISTSDEVTDFESFREIFLGDDNMDVVAKDLFELVNDASKIPPTLTVETKNNNLLELKILTPIVDDFLRYHRDTERLETDGDKPFTMPLVSNNNAKNIQMALLYQQRKKKENTRAQLIVNKIDAISDYYSDNVKNNSDVTKDIKKYFQNPLAYRKAIMHNYLEEVRVMNKIRNQGRRAIEGNEYYLELIQAISNAYFNFKDFQRYGTSVNIYPERPINTIRYSNIENQSQMSHLEIDMHTVVSDSMVNIVGLALGPFTDGPIQCIRKENLLDIRNVKINYYKDGKVVTRTTDNGYKAFIKIIKHFYINTISLRTYPKFEIYNDFDEIRKLNQDIFNKVIYWIYDIDKDIYEMDTYENLKTYNFQETIRFMNSIVHDRIIGFLNKRLVKLIDQNKDLSLFKIEQLVELYSTVNRLLLKQDDKREIIIQEYLRSIGGQPSQILPIPEADRIEMPEFIPISEITTFRMKIDTINPLHPQEHIKLEAYSKESREKSIISKIESKCQHEMEWNELLKLKSDNLNKYNEAATQFVEKFAIETTQLDFVCNICGQVLPLKQYVQDGSFDNNTQKFVTAYVPLDIPLEEIKEYAKYKLTIRTLDGLINRVSLITGTNMLVGPNTQIKQKRKALVKNIIDIIVKHNSVNLKKNINYDERSEFFSKKFNIDKNADSVYFFELDDSILNFKLAASDTDADENRLKYHNILLYFMLIFITELNGAQIAMMYTDKIANIYTFLKYGSKLFGDLLIKKNINDMETIPITKYPVLCYLIFLISYFLITYKIWFVPGQTTNKFNPYVQRVIINSFVDLFNSISMDAGKMQNDYTYLLTTSKLYTQLNSTFKNNEIIRILQRNHARYSDKPSTEAQVPIVAEEDLIKTYSISNPIVIIRPTRKIPTYKISDGIVFDRLDKILYPEMPSITDLTNCPDGSYHIWTIKGGEIVSAACGLTGNDVTGDIDRTNEAYYFNLNVIANRRCIEGTIHDFVGKDGQFVCTICGRNAGEKYSDQELDELANNLDRLENQNIQKVLQNINDQKRTREEDQEFRDQLINELVSSFREETGDKLYGQITVQTDKLIGIMESLLGADTNLDIDKYPVYLRDNVYIIDHSYDGTAFNEPIILTEKDNRINFRENHSYFKTDVYYYTDNRTQIDVFYHAVTLKLLGYKEKHKEFVKINKANTYLKISPSIKNRFLTLGFETQYIDIGDIFTKNSKFIKDTNQNYFHILDSIIRDHIFKIKSVVDKVASVLYKIKNYQPPTQETEGPQIFLQTTQAMDKLVSKYAKILRDFRMGADNNSFDDWNELRNSFTYKQINWEETNVRPTGNLYINSDLINYYDIASNLMIYYMVNELISIIDSNNERIAKINIVQMFIEVIIYIYSIYNIDPYKNSLELKRFEYILNGSEVMVDILKRGQGLMQSKELEEQLDDDRPDLTDTVELTPDEEEIEDLKEEAEALDIEGDYFAEEDEDYAQEGDYEE